MSVTVGKGVIEVDVVGLSEVAGASLVVLVGRGCTVSLSPPSSLSAMSSLFLCWWCFTSVSVDCMLVAVLTGQSGCFLERRALCLFLTNCLPSLLSLE